MGGATRARHLLLTLIGSNQKKGGEIPWQTLATNALRIGRMYQTMRSVAHSKHPTMTGADMPWGGRFFPEIGSLIRYSLEWLEKRHLDQNGYPIVPLYGEIIAFDDDDPTMFRVKFIDDLNPDLPLLEEWYDQSDSDKMVVVSPPQQWQLS